MRATVDPHHPTYSPSDDENPELEDGLAAQRRALEEMSQQLLDKLNVMEAEQEARAQEFAQRVHSVATLPGQGAWQAQTAALKQVTPPGSAQKKETRQSQPPRHEPTKSTSRGRAALRAGDAGVKWENPEVNLPEKTDNKGCFFLIVVLFIIYCGLQD